MRAVPRALTSAASFVLPGVGQALRQRWIAAVLFLFCAFWLRLILSASAQTLRPAGVEPMDAATYGFFAFPSGFHEPVVVIVTALVVVLHLWAAYDAWAD